MTSRGLKHFFAEPCAIDDRSFIRGIGIREAMPPARIDRPVGTGDHLLMCFHDPVWLPVEPGGPERHFAPPTLVWWPPGERQCYQGRRAGWRHSWIHWDGPAAESCARAVEIAPGLPCPLQDDAPLEQALGHLHEEIAWHARPDPLILQALVTCLQQQLRRAIHGEPRPVAADLLALRRTIALEPEAPWTLADLAARLGCSIPRLCARFRAAFGIAPKAYVIHCRLQRAAFLLRDAELPVATVAQRVGYDDLYHFSKLFRRHRGCSPSAWRKRMLSD